MKNQRRVTLPHSEDDDLASATPRAGLTGSDRGMLLSRISGLWITLGAVAGGLASFVLSIDEVKIAANPHFVPNCNINPIIACGTVMKTPEAHVFGFPNPFIGVFGFGVMVTVGMVLLAGVRLPKWFLAGAAVGTTAGAVFIHWLAYHTLYAIGALCPWCMVVWAVTMPMAVWFVLAAAAAYTKGGPHRLVLGIWRWRFSLMVLWYLMIVVAILTRFWSYWSTHLF